MNNEDERPRSPEHGEHTTTCGARIFWSGDVSLLSERTPRIAVVGSRSATRDGLRRCDRLARELARAGVVVVSGLARGIDTTAHRAAMDAGGRTVAVLGTPLDVAYPPENRELQGTIARDHLALSQFSPGHQTQRRDFVLRNDTMARVTHASVLVECRDHSGTLTHAAAALRLGHPVFVMRSLLARADLSWPSSLLKRPGARVLTHTEQVLQDLRLQLEPW